MASRDRTPLRTEMKWFVGVSIVVILLAIAGFAWFLQRHFDL
jgi:hypothetical protein